MKNYFKLLTILSTVFIISCEGDDISSPLTIEKEIPVVADTKFDQGFFVSSEGGFGRKDGSVAYIANDFSEVSSFAYKKVNDVDLAGLIQSVTFSETKAYFILNDVNTITISDKVTLKKEAVVTSKLSNPRYMAIVGNKGYITNWGDRKNTMDDFLAILDLNTNKIEETTIPIAGGAERIIYKEGKLYIAHGGAPANNIISVIDISDLNNQSTIETKDKPEEIFFLEDGTLVTLAEGKTVFNDKFEIISGPTEGAITFIDIASNTVTKEIVFSADNTSSYLVNEGDNLFYHLGTKVFKISKDATALALEDTGIEVGSIYALGVKDSKIYTSVTDFVSLSNLFVRNADDGKTIFTTTVGTGASKIYFNN